MLQIRNQQSVDKRILGPKISFLKISHVGKNHFWYF